jgi:AAA ATPase domain
VPGTGSAHRGPVAARDAARRAGAPPDPRSGGARWFAGREPELHALDDTLDQVAADGARVVLVEGPVGIGKTAMLRRFVGRHRGLRVFWWSGADSRPSASFALVDRIFAPLGVRAHTLPIHAERTLPGEQPVEVGRRLLQALTGLRQDRPIALVIDDAHTADLDSLRAVLFALRRLSTHPVMTVFVTRSRNAGLPEGLVRLAECARTGFVLPVGPMLPAEVQDLALTVGVTDLPLRTACRLSAHTLGNPRHLLALFAETPVDAWRLDRALPAPHLFSRTVGRMLDSCAPATRRLVEAVSVLDDLAVLSTAAALVGVDEPLDAVEEACRAGLLATPPPVPAWRLAFPDPLVRAAVYGQLTAERRARLHLAAAALVDDEGAARHHRDLATGWPDR